jgi:hypothetical protein
MMDLPTFAQENSKSMIEILNQFETITLDEMRNIRLMNRIDTKFITTVPVLRQLLMLARDEYFVQQVDGEVIAPYYTLYFDTEDYAMYNRHEVGHLDRQKLRVRSYLHVGINYLEVKTKNNHGRTKKNRTFADEFDPLAHETCSFRLHDYDEFITSYLRYDPQRLSEQLENRFDRITLVNRAKTERLTIDINLRFHNIGTGNDRFMGNLVIIELKRDGHQPSPILPRLLQLRIHPHGFSKYCIGSALTNETLRRNRIKPRLHNIQKLINV